MKARLDDMLSKSVPEAEIMEAMDLLKDRFADYGRLGCQGRRDVRACPLRCLHA